jgi:hypothetical protein
VQAAAIGAPGGRLHAQQRHEKPRRAKPDGVDGGQRQAHLAADGGAAAGEAGQFLRIGRPDFGESGLERLAAITSGPSGSLP